MIYKTIGIPYLGRIGDRWIDATTGQHRVCSRGCAWENIDAATTHPDEVVHTNRYEHVRYSWPDANSALLIPDQIEVSHEEQAVELDRSEAVPGQIQGDVSTGDGTGATPQADGDHGELPGAEPEQGREVQVSAALVDVGIDSDNPDVV